ncbi:MAG: hypothetical protein Q9159_000927 [Coniocarpon cinnabarinum]
MSHLSPHTSIHHWTKSEMFLKYAQKNALKRSRGPSHAASITHHAPPSRDLLLKNDNYPFYRYQNLNNLLRTRKKMRFTLAFLTLLPLTLAAPTHLLRPTGPVDTSSTSTTDHAKRAAEPVPICMEDGPCEPRVGNSHFYAMGSAEPLEGEPIASGPVESGEGSDGSGTIV